MSLSPVTSSGKQTASFFYFYFYFFKRARERERGRERETRERETERDRDIDIDTDRHRQTDRETERQTQRHRQTQTDRQIHRQTDREKKKKKKQIKNENKGSSTVIRLTKPDVTSLSRVVSDQPENIPGGNIVFGKGSLYSWIICSRLPFTPGVKGMNGQITVELIQQTAQTPWGFHIRHTAPPLVCR